jgi:hypothetical protein
MIDDNTDAKKLMQKMNHHPTTLFLFDPVKGHYANAMALYVASRKLLMKKNYGNAVTGGSKKDKEKVYATPDDELKKTFKGTIFDKCSLPYEVFHLQRRTQLNIKQVLSRIGFLVLRDGSLEVKTSNSKNVEDNEVRYDARSGKNLNVGLLPLIKEAEKRFDMGSQYAKPDFFVPFPVIEGLASADSL